MTNYIIEYTVTDASGTKSGMYRVKNCYNEMHAKAKFSLWMQKKNPYASVIIKKCYEDVYSILKDIFGI